MIASVPGRAGNHHPTLSHDGLPDTSWLPPGNGPLPVGQPGSAGEPVGGGPELSWLRACQADSESRS
eukprot:1246396-Rhodomonas_salina.1